MRRHVTDDDIRSFLVKNAARHESQISLIQSALDSLWPDGASRDAAERVVVAALAKPSLAPRTRKAHATAP